METNTASSQHVCVETLGDLMLDDCRHAVTSNGADLLILHSADMKPQGCRLQARRLIMTCLPEGVKHPS